MGNEWEDETAKLASFSLDSPSKPISYGSTCAQIRERTRDPTPEHQRVKAVCKALSTTLERQITNRRDQTLLAQLRSDHSSTLQAYRHRIGIADSPLCPKCQQEAQDLEQWFQRCLATKARRRTLFGAENGRVDCLTRYPRRVVTGCPGEELAIRGRNLNPSIFPDDDYNFCELLAVQPASTHTRPSINKPLFLTSHK